jgi:DNA-binding PadR family transcriptional regulator
MRRDMRVFEAVFLQIMSDTKDGRIYGYELSAKARELSDGHGAPSYGVIYPFLRRMERAEVVRSKKDESSGRVYYELTRKGKLDLQELPQRLKEAQGDLGEHVLGTITLYSKLYGQEALNDLLKRLKTRRKNE